MKIRWELIRDRIYFIKEDDSVLFYVDLQTAASILVEYYLEPEPGNWKVEKRSHENENQS